MERCPSLAIVCKQMASTRTAMEDELSGMGIKETLLRRVRDGQWADVVNIYRTRPSAHKLRLSRSGDTALHVAISNGEEETAESLVTLVGNLNIEDKERNTPLHLAAAMGSARLCRRIAERDPGLAGLLNKDGFNPIFMAVLRGRKDAFLALIDNPRCRLDEYLTMENGDTILHKAIYNDYMELAFVIANRFKELTSSKNESGMTPLHVLATRPFSFRSATATLDSYSEDLDAGDRSSLQENQARSFENCKTCFRLVKMIISIVVHLFKVIFYLVKNPLRAMFSLIKKDASEEQHKWSVKVLKKLLDSFDFDNGAMAIENRDMYEGVDTPILFAARYGITEIVHEILKKFPDAIEDTNSEGKNAVLLAVEHRQRDIYALLHNKRTYKRDIVLGKVDNEGNSALHLAARKGKSWNVSSGKFFWEIQWYEYIRISMPSGFFAPYNKDGKTAREILEERDGELVEKWTSEICSPCSVVAALIASVAFPTSLSVPGDFNDSNNGKPRLQDHPAFSVFAIASLVALCSSITSLVMFLGIMIADHQQKEFRNHLPWKMLVGLASLFASIGATLVSFFAGHFFVLKDPHRPALILVYALACLPVAYFIIEQSSAYLALLFATLSNQFDPKLKGFSWPSLRTRRG